MKKYTNIYNNVYKPILVVFQIVIFLTLEVIF